MPLIFAIASTTILQIIYWVSKPGLFWLCYDCGEYLDLAKFIFLNPKNFISDLRPPLYPLLLIMHGFGNGPGSELVLYITQSVLLILSEVLIWKISGLLRLSPRICWLPVVLFALSPTLYPFAKQAMTEIPNTFLLLLVSLVILNFKNRPNLRNAFLAGGLTEILIFTRFANSYLGFLFLGLVAFYLRGQIKNKRILAFLLLYLACLLIPPTLYSFANYHRNYYFGLTGETGANLLGKLVQYQLIPKADPTYQKIIDQVSVCTGQKAGADVYSCIWNFLPKNSFVSKYSVLNTQVDDFTKKTIMKNIVPYTLKSIPVAIASVSSPNDVYLILFKETTNPIFPVSVNIFKIIHILLVFWVLSIPIFVLLSLKRTIRGELFLPNLLLVIVIYYLTITGLAAINNYERIVTPALPFMYLLIPPTCQAMIAKILLIINRFKTKQ